MFDRVKKLLGQDWEDVTEMIRASLKSDIGLLDATNASILSNGGKRLRPIISLLAARACSGGESTKDSIRFAAATELLHNATLLHDDVVDNSPQRRGMPTVMSLLGGPASVLIGDYWLVKAMDLILFSKTHGDVVIRIFAKTLSDLAEGEMLQMEKAGSCDTVEEDYLKIIYHKTASLFEAAGISAAISVSAPERMREAVREYCVDLGIAFQIKDDMLDYSGGEALGKPVGADLDERKITLPLLGALSCASPEEEREMRAKIRDIDSHPEYKTEIRDFVVSKKGDVYAALKLEEYVGKAILALEALPDSEEKDCLVQIARFTAGRNR